MNQPPQEPNAFAEYVASVARKLKPGVHIEINSPHELLLEGRRLDIDNLFRLVAQRLEQGEDVVEQYLQSLFTGDVVSGASSLPVDVVRPMIMPRIQPRSVFDRLDERQVAHVPYVNNTVVLFVIDLPQMTVSITTEQLVRWGIAVEEIELLARENLRTYRQELTFRYIETPEGGRAAMLSHYDGYDAARLLLDELHHTLAPQLGGDFLVATPARDVLIAVSRESTDFLLRIHERVERDYEKLPYPITTDFFYVTLDGVAGAKAA